MNYTKSVLIDNWSLELTSTILDGQIGLTENTKRDQISALLDFLDIFILNENLLYYDNELTYAWKRLKSLDNIKDFINPINNIEKLNLYPEILNNDNSDGANFYLKLADKINSNYWPSPKRKKYIDSLKINQKEDFITILANDLKSELKTITSEIYNKLDISKPIITPSFGSMVLLECSDIKSIIPTAIQIRDDIYTKEFRKWGQLVNEAIAQGNIIFLNNQLKEIEQITTKMLKQFSIQQDNKYNIKLQLGLRPSISLEVNEIGKKIKNAFSRKKAHFVFMKNYLNKSIQNADLSYKIEELFKINS